LNLKLNISDQTSNLFVTWEWCFCKGNQCQHWYRPWNIA